MPIVDVVTISASMPTGDTSELEDKQMAKLDEDSMLHWKEQLYKTAQAANDGHTFVMEQGRLNFLEGKVGLRESIALKNVPPINAGSGS
jgi:hypothetical protein